MVLRCNGKYVYSLEVSNLLLYLQNKFYSFLERRDELNASKALRKQTSKIRGGGEARVEVYTIQSSEQYSSILNFVHQFLVDKIGYLVVE